MNSLNYQHLYYFFVVAQAGGVNKASEKLMLAPSTISAQISTLEGNIGKKLFDRTNKGIKLTRAGHAAFGYAGEIFSLGDELVDVINEQRHERPLRVGINEALPKLVVYELLNPAYKMSEGIRLICHEASREQLATEVTTREVDIVISDGPMLGVDGVEMNNQPLGKSPVSWYAKKELAAKYKEDYPKSMNEAPILLPVIGSPIRNKVALWLTERGLRPWIRGEFDDSALMKVFASSGKGIFPAPTIIEKKLAEQYGVYPIGEIEGVEEVYYAVTHMRTPSHPGITLIREGGV